MSVNEVEDSLSIWSGVYDVVNISDPDLNREVSDLLLVGMAPIIINRMQNGVDFMVSQLQRRLEKSGKIDLLRIHGHGGPGLQTISCDRDLRGFDLSTSRAFISNYNFQNIVGSLGLMRGLFAPNAQVWLMGCEVGAEFEGRRLINRLAKLWGVPVTAGLFIQFAGWGRTRDFEEYNPQNPQESVLIKGERVNRTFSIDWLKATALP